MESTTNTPVSFEEFHKGKYGREELIKQAYEQYKQEFEQERKLREEKTKTNCVAAIAYKADRDYITPEDVAEALKTNPEDKVRVDTLECLGRVAHFGVEDASLTAFVAFEGKK